MDDFEKELAMASSQRPKISLKVAVCERCGGNPDKLYLCERHHNLFCYDCLAEVIETGYSSTFVAKCSKNGDCCFNPIGKKSWEN